ncbi:SPOR domain-containing protein [Rhodoferax aquaticus]|uniref:SPOR domain-containing protein n=1 Tax=Rhodoferax aquaticus TaxID=2527691 RepID=A0A515EMJ7_9BURK|nr:SPOR domain-containing protein [Rhodoferax aquaticus]QDL53873.1 SPOR domain-containing protein [Rhodoferax aquaticus]
MAFFKFRNGGDEQASPPPTTESVEAMRKRARHRLIGAAVLVLAGVLGFPLLFDNQPRPMAVDIPIEIPDKAKVKPLAVTPPAAATPVSSGSVETVVTAAPVVPASKATDKPSEKPPEKTPVVADTKPSAPPVDPKPTAPAAAPASKPADAGLPRVDDGAKARALLEGKEPEKKTEDVLGRFVVQVGAYSDVLKAREARVKLEKAGLKTYTQVVEPKEGKRIRVRVGPFESKAEAEKAAEKIKKLDLPASVLEL